MAWQGRQPQSCGQQTPHLCLGDEAREHHGNRFRKSERIGNESAGVIASVKEKKVADVALVEATGRRTQMAEFPSPLCEHGGTHSVGTRMLALDKVVPLSQYRGFAQEYAAESTFGIHIALE